LSGSRSRPTLGTAEITRKRITVEYGIATIGEAMAAISPLQAIAQTGEILPLAQSPHGMSHGGISSMATA